VLLRRCVAETKRETYFRFGPTCVSICRLCVTQRSGHSIDKAKMDKGQSPRKKGKTTGASEWNTVGGREQATRYSYKNQQPQRRS